MLIVTNRLKRKFSVKSANRQAKLSTNIKIFQTLVYSADWQPAPPSDVTCRQAHISSKTEERGQGERGGERRGERRRGERRGEERGGRIWYWTMFFILSKLHSVIRCQGNELIYWNYRFVFKWDIIDFIKNHLETCVRKLWMMMGRKRRMSGK